jgi:hypothetical protein
LVYLVHRVGLVQPNKRDRPDRPNRPDEQDRLADFFSILLEVLARLHQQIQQVLVSLCDMRQANPKA